MSADVAARAATTAGGSMVRKRARNGWSEPLAEAARVLAMQEDVDLDAAEVELKRVVAIVKKRRMEMGGDALLEKMVAATCAGEEGVPSKDDTRKLLSLLRAGKSEARCSFSEEGSSVGGNCVEVELEGFYTIGSHRYGISGAVSNQEGEIRLSEAVHVEGLDYFCEDDGMQRSAGALGDDNDAAKWAELAQVKMAEGEVMHIIAVGLSVMLAQTHTGNAKDGSYGVDPVDHICGWVQEAVGSKYPQSK